ncbi:MAG: GTPase Era [Porticoccaceae bacterium]|nr:GTPase Era [Porticoccaceae bacterium]MBT3798226.1 GTPase Era [Porticoccaceae bacterium]MBT4165274.1 GTPase Era [Porticoccaceae bacterium]MBT4210703.1 GTPase Era [Porticoccaceae bacterium]MBT4591629.1 GTPase Era [Porticoccaceae bacterium]
MTLEQKYCGYVAIVGRPNVGKSTLLNHLLGQKLCITSRKPQTTRHTLLGIKTEGEFQMIFVDTPGIHTNQERAINRVMNRSAASVIADVDVVIFVVDRLEWSEADEYVAKYLSNNDVPLIVAVNKIDMIDDKEALLPHLNFLSSKVNAEELIPLSALRRTNLDELETKIKNYIPQKVHLYPEDQITDRSERFLAAEIVREKITRQLGAEVPYQVTVEIEEFRAEKKITHISALILVERDGQKKIIIGTNGERLKKIGEQARADIESLLGCKVMLRTWVKVRSGWSDDERALRSLGYMDE